MPSVLRMLVAGLAFASGVEAQVPPGGEPSRTVVFDESAAADGYGLRTAALGGPALVLGAVNMTTLPAGGRALGLLGVVLGVGQAALVFEGLTTDESYSNFTIAVNAVGTAFSIAAGVRQIRSQTSEPSEGGLSAALAPSRDGVGLLITWRSP